MKNHLKKYILLFPFCSPHLSIKKWPYYNDLIQLIFNKFGDEYKVVTAPGPDEINEAKNINAIALLDNGKALNISHVEAKGLTLFGKHTTAYKVSIERENFKAIQVTDLNNLGVDKVFERLIDGLV